MEIKAAVFDVDGLLLDTEGLQWRGWVEVLKQYGIGLSKEQYFDYAGKSSSVIESQLIERYKLDVRKGLLVEQKKDLIAKWFSTKLRLMPHAKEAVEFFIKNKIKVATASGSIRKENVLKLKSGGLLHLFPTIISLDDVKRGKPYPDMYVFAAKRLGLKPEECLVFEDTEFGATAAKTAGMICIAIPSEYSVKQDFSMADAVCKNLKEAVEYAKKTYDI